MIKMNAPHPLLVQGEARTEFETDEQHARELELAGLAVRVLTAEVAPVADQQINAENVADAEVSKDAKQLAAATPAINSPEPVAPVAAAKPKKAK